VAGFVGPNGAGKSTTIRMLLGLITPTGGEGEVFGHPIGRPAAYLHASIQTTLNVYGHLFKSLDERLAEALDATHREAEGQAAESSSDPPGSLGRRA
jgi:ABC-type multidrug transport system ATPase subunit